MASEEFLNIAIFIPNIFQYFLRMPALAPSLKVLPKVQKDYPFIQSFEAQNANEAKKAILQIVLLTVDT